MSKVIPILLASHYEQKSQSTALLVKITRRDGEIFGCTSHDVDLSYLGMTWEAGLPSLEPAQTVHTSAFASDNTDLSGLLAADGLTQVDIESGIWDGAAVEVWRVNWRMLSGLAGANVPLLGTGEIGDYYLDLWTGIYYGPKTEAGWGVGEVDRARDPRRRRAWPVLRMTVCRTRSSSRAWRIACRRRSRAPICRTAMPPLAMRVAGWTLRCLPFPARLRR